MSTTPLNDGGPAFPVHCDTASSDGGMSLRDWFAGQALAGILAAESDDNGYSATYIDASGKETFRHSSPFVGADGKENYTVPAVPNKMLRSIVQNQARAAYAVADAMLAARTATPNSPTP